MRLQPHILSKGVATRRVWPEIKDPVTPTFAKVKLDSGSIIGEVLDVDGFGNVITNINEKDAEVKEGKTVNVEIAGCHAENPVWKSLRSGKTQRTHPFSRQPRFLGNRFKPSKRSRKIPPESWGQNQSRGCLKGFYNFFDYVNGVFQFRKFTFDIKFLAKILLCVS